MLNIAKPSNKPVPTVNENFLRRKEKYSFTAKKNRRNNKVSSSESQFNLFNSTYDPSVKKEQRQVSLEKEKE